jgi:hypothetical protein
MATELTAAPDGIHEERTTAARLVALLVALLACASVVFLLPWGALLAVAAIVFLVRRVRTTSDTFSRRLLWGAIVLLVLAVAIPVATTVADLRVGT